MQSRFLTGGLRSVFRHQRVPIGCSRYTSGISRSNKIVPLQTQKVSLPAIVNASSHSRGKEGFSDEEREEQNRFANMGEIVDIIRNSTPGLLQRNFPKEIISDAVKLRILPDSHPTIPDIHGRVSYNTVVRLLQFTVTHILLPPQSEIMILSARLCGEYKAGEAPPKFMIRWRTYSEENSPTNSFPSSFSARSINFAPSQLAGGLGLLPHEFPVLTGIFEFEFNYDCSLVDILTITDLEYLSKPVEESIAGGMA